MKNIAALIVLSILLSLNAWSQQATWNPNRHPSAHNETPDMAYSPNRFGNLKTSPGGRYKSTGFFTIQVNVDASGNNIIGDAANEPSIAVDFKNTNNMAIGWRQFDDVFSNFRQAGVGYSYDGGQSWTFPGVIEPGIFRSDPVLDTDTTGRVFYNSLTNDNGVYLCKVFRSDDGILWDAGVDAKGGDKQWMIIDRSTSEGNGNIYSFWTEYWSSCQPGYFTRSTDGGDSYEECITVDGTPYWGTLATGPEGELYMAGAGAWEGVVVTRSDNARTAGSVIQWDNTAQVWLDGYISSGANVNPAGLLGQASVAVDGSEGPGRGTVYVLASVVRGSTGDPGDVMFARSSDGGTTWSNPLRINNDESTLNTQWFGTMSVAPNGRIDVVWLDTRDDPATHFLSSLYYCYSEDQGTTWSINKRLSDSFDPSVGYPQQNKMGDYFDMKSDNAGAHLAWANTLNGEQDVYYTHIIPTIVGMDESAARSQLTLNVMPNPCISRSDIRFTVPSGYARLTLTDMTGREIAPLAEGEYAAGTYSAELNAGDLTPGCYLITLTMDAMVKSTRVMVFPR